MKKLLLMGVLLLGFTSLASAQGVVVSLYVDSSPDFESEYYDDWETTTILSIVNGTFKNMTNGVNSLNVGTTNFELADETYDPLTGYSNLSFIYYIQGYTTADLDGEIELSLVNYLSNDGETDIFDTYYGSEWQSPIWWFDYGNGVIGVESFAWYSDEIDGLAQQDESWTFTVRDATSDTILGSITATRNAVPEPATMILFSTGLAGAFIRKRFAA